MHRPARRRRLLSRWQGQEKQHSRAPQPATSHKAAQSSPACLHGGIHRRQEKEQAAGGVALLPVCVAQRVAKRHTSQVHAGGGDYAPVELHSNFVQSREWTKLSAGVVHC